MVKTKKILCTVCGQKFPTKDMMITHRQKHMKKIIKTR